MTGLRCFIFDLDGTLVFNEEANFLAYKAAFKSVGLTLKKNDFLSYFRNGGSIEEIHANFVKKNKINPQPNQLTTIKALKAKEYVRYFHLIKQNEAIVGLLKALSGHYHTALATSSQEENARNILNHFGLTDLFDFMVFSGDVGKKKPDPECHQKIAAHFGVKPEECLVFEDSPKGFAAAEAFGAHICKVVQ
ncbi:MAG TPA: HAD family phosphatase [Candidatus Saccharimonadales bacterium]|nr:HAD family phosphatase [Candidatus Saccharimonadales bacterium]